MPPSLDGVRADSVRSRQLGGNAISPVDSADADTVYDFDRLERAVAALIAQHEQMQKESSDLRRALAGRDQRIEALEGQLLDANQRRQDTGKRIDELIAQLDQLDAQLESLGLPK